MFIFVRKFGSCILSLKISRCSFQERFWIYIFQIWHIEDAEKVREKYMKINFWVQWEAWSWSGNNYLTKTRVFSTTTVVTQFVWRVTRASMASIYHDNYTIHVCILCYKVLSKLSKASVALQHRTYKQPHINATEVN